MGEKSLCLKKEKAGLGLCREPPKLLALSFGQQIVEVECSSERGVLSCFQAILPLKSKKREGTPLKTGKIF